MSPATTETDPKEHRDATEHQPQLGKPSAVMNPAKTWMLYGAAGYTGTLIAQRGLESGHRPVLAGRNATAVIALAERLNLPHRVLTLDDPSSMHAALSDVDLVLNAAGPFLHTAS